MKSGAEARKNILGHGVFIEDIMDKDACHIMVKRSRISRGRIKGMVFPELPPGVRIIRAKDIPGKNSLSVFGTAVPILSAGEVRYKGEPILLLTGSDEKVLGDLLEQIVIDYEEEEPVYDFDNPKQENIFHTRRVQRGTPRQPEGEEKSLTREFHAGIQEHFYAEPHGAYARWNEDTSSLDILSSSRWPFHVHQTLCEVLALPHELVTVVIPESHDSSLGGKLWYPSLMAAHAALAAWLTRKNIKVLFSREEDFLYTPKSAPAVIRYTAVQDPDGVITSAQVRMLINMGAYAVFARETVERAAAGVLGAYHCPNLLVEVSAARTNLPPLGPFTGMGSSQSLFAAEVLAEQLREAAEMNPVEWKKANLYTKTKPSLTGILPRDHLPPPEILDAAARISGFTRKHAAFELARKRRSAAGRLPDNFRGIGIAIGCQGSGFLGAMEDRLAVSAELFMDTDGKLRISQPAIPGNRALHEIWKAAAAESLGISPDDIHIAPVHTEGSKDGGPSFFSRGITIMTKLIEDGCELFKKKRFRSPLPLSVSNSFKLPSSIDWDDENFTGTPFFELSWAAAVVELRVDPLTFTPKIEGIWMVVDGGKILNPAEARRSIETAISAAVGWSLFEHIEYAHGAIPRQQFTAYRIPTAEDVPAPQIEFFEAAGKLPVKGIGELAAACIPAACVNALNQALDIRLSGIPVPPETRKFMKEAPL